MWAVKNLRFLLPFFLLKSVSLGKNVFLVLFYFFKPCKVGSNAHSSQNCAQTAPNGRVFISSCKTMSLVNSALS